MPRIAFAALLYVFVIKSTNQLVLNAKTTTTTTTTLTATTTPTTKKEKKGWKQGPTLQSPPFFWLGRLGKLTK